MNQIRRQQWLDARIADAVARRHQTRTEIQRGRGGAPKPGDVFAFAETAEYPVQWAVIEQDPQNTERLLVIAVDSSPLVGSSDIAVPVEATTGASCLRCAFQVWLEAGHFDPELRTGFLEPEVLEQARSKRTEIERGNLTASSRQLETDTEPEYLDWVQQVLEKAQVELSGEDAAVAPSRSQEPVEVVTEPELEEQPQDWRRLEAALRQEIADLKQRLASFTEPLVNLPFVWLTPSGLVRGDVKTLEIPSRASFFLLILEVSDPHSHPVYRLEIRAKDTGTTVWSSDELRITGITELNVALPRQLLPAGEYRLHLYGLRGGQAEPVEEFSLRIENISSQ